MDGKEEKDINFYKLLSIFKIYSLPSNPMDFYCLFKLDYNNLLLLPNLTTIDAGGMLCWIVLNACKYALMFRGPEQAWRLFFSK